MFPAAQLSAHKYVQEDPSLRLVCLVVDCGYSFTHIVPVYQGKIVKEGVQRYESVLIPNPVSIPLGKTAMIEKNPRLSVERRYEPAAIAGEACACYEDYATR